MPRLRRYSARIGTNAWENAPSAKRRRNRFGRRKAASNASICRPAPKTVALSVSRKSPVMRDRSVIPLTVVRVRRRFNSKRGFAGRLVRDAKIAYYAAFTRIGNSKTKRHGQHRTGTQACAAGRGDAPAQRQPEIGAPHGSEEGEEGDRFRRQGR